MFHTRIKTKTEYCSSYLNKNLTTCCESVRLIDLLFLLSSITARVSSILDNSCFICLVKFATLHVFTNCFIYKYSINKADLPCYHHNKLMAAYMISKHLAYIHEQWPGWHCFSNKKYIIIITISVSKLWSDHEYW